MASSNNNFDFNWYTILSNRFDFGLTLFLFIQNAKTGKLLKESCSVSGMTQGCNDRIEGWGQFGQKSGNLWDHGGHQCSITEGPNKANQSIGRPCHKPNEYIWNGYFCHFPFHFFLNKEKSWIFVKIQFVFYLHHPLKYSTFLVAADKHFFGAVFQLIPASF